MKNLCGTSLLVTSVLATAGFTTLAMGQVANDECSTATVVTAGVPVAFTNVGATSSANPAPVDTFCAGTFLDWGTTNPDVWFRFTAAENGNADFSTCDIAGFDTSMALYTGTCGALTQVGCNGDAAADAACQQFFSKITGFSVTAGTTYYIRVGGWNGTTTGTATLTVTVTPVGAGCNGATGGCGVVHATPGCDDATCCTAVCTANPLCCEIGWDETCVQGAVAACGIFVYQCLTPNPAVSNDCATNATVVTADGSFAINNNGCNTDGPNHAAATCSSGNDFFLNDVWYRTQAPANGTMRVATCNASTFDTKVAVYAMGTNPAAFDYNTLNTALVGCNDDGSTECQVGATFASELTVNVNQGNWYLVRCATYDIPGTCTLTIDLPAPCALPVQTGVEAEACGSATNNGCNALGEVEDIILGSRIKGTFWADANTRDTDFYRLTVTADSQVTVNVSSGQFVTTLVLGGDISVAACAGISVLSTGAGNCPASASVCLNPGTYYIFVAPAAFTGAPCGSGFLNDYVVEVTSAPASCPDLIGGVCNAPGPNTATINSANTAANGLVRCASQPAFPNCAQGGTTANSYARSLPVGAVAGTISCVNFGVWSVARDTNAAGTACGLFLSDLPLPATVGVYRDIDGGNPRNKIVTAGDGNDLELIDSRQVLVPGVAAVQTLNFDPPLCVDSAAANNLVIILDFPNMQDGSTGIPANSGYQQLAGGNTADPSSATFIRLACADAALAYVVAESLGATFTARWYVAVNGDFSGCGTPCPTDLNGDGSTGSADLSILLNGWGGTSPDLNGDGSVGSADLSVLLNGWGACP